MDTSRLKRPFGRLLSICCVIALLGSANVFAKSSGPASTRAFEFTYQTTIGPVPAGQGPVHIFIPIAIEHEVQEVLSFRVETSITGEVETEPTYGNLYWHGKLDISDGKPINVKIDYLIARRPVNRDVPTKNNKNNIDKMQLDLVDKQRFAKFLQANEKVIVGHKILDPILAEIRKTTASQDPGEISRGIFDWVIDNIEYKKVGSGWGNGDTFWACNQRYGNCTDFHSLFISLARTEGIPARFEMGLPLPTDRSEGKISGYHCWMALYLKGPGWFPIDASEAFKHPEQREQFYGNQPADRILFTIGRDLRLGQAHVDQPLNYFIYPYVEVQGKKWQGQIQNNFSYRDRESSAKGLTVSETSQGDEVL